ncbi:NrdH-like glutaredoxin [Mycobacterium phage Smurph]|uniref:NrdH-like glutaredoxin n=9 Tax=Charlievirus TaxID=1623280 RepID=A0A142K7X0_9CAUD|nr:thioredoxin domain [Mycobacterium phage Carcharodon]YP_009616903.1 thioredoxin domain [Mycobacterium phage Pipsqueaks]YP_010052186.1 thioredoxin domain [Mycobacterium phage Fulbright]AMS01996.1 NrdH-like glutaredoxin [Mycobacterium phage Xerxes]AWY04132.1 NrdH-like glutaredoxin [Mycobacterium phage Silvafighter]AXQ52620.1 NrdH-like glutaredoxin [Mycobacterium phage Gex]AYQ98276.1 NrdH-like glutaredoxin [Mycobacterium phage Chewbacca]QBI98606.1 NrdH-like glutaredoxin [Mycobacterium phage P
MKPVVTVYTTTNCQGCTLTKKHLAKLGIDYTEVPIDSDESIRAAIEELGYSTAPVVCASTDEGELHWSDFRYDRIKALKAAA